MAPLGPFAQPPRVAVAVSGGPDSLALALLAQAWAQHNAGPIVALTVDHGLREAAAAEARQVRQWLAAQGISHHILKWRGPKPARGVQAAAREARYRLLADWCRRHGMLNLLLAHHCDDQAETVLFRLTRGSGLDGLAGMAAITERSGIRLLRPLLGIPKARLRATLVAADQEWIEDPSNLDPAFARTRVRDSLRTLAAAGVAARDLAAAARDIASQRVALEEATGGLLARAVTLHPAGFCLLDPDVLAAVPEALARRGLMRVLMCVGGSAYPPRLDRLERLHQAVRQGELGGGRTLLGCRVLPYRARLLCCREAAAADDVAALDPAAEVMWDGRFAVRLRRQVRTGTRTEARLTVRRLGRAGWQEVLARQPDLRAASLPPPVRPTLPALWRGRTLIGVPHAGFWVSPRERVEFRFKPAQPLAPAPFAVV